MYIICKENTQPVIKKNGMKPALIKNTFSKNYVFFIFFIMDTLTCHWPTICHSLVSLNVNLNMMFALIKS